MRELRILLVDKNLSYLEVAKKMLKFHNEDYIIDVATKGEECFEKLLNHHYDLVLLDYDIDNKSGLSVLNKIIRSGFDVTIIMMVEEGKEDIAFKALEGGASDYIMKVRGYLTALPFTVGKVLERKKRPEQPVSDAKIPASMNASPNKEAYFILDRQGRFISSNQMLERISSYSEDELLELTLPDLLPQEQENRFTRWLSGVDLGYTTDSLKIEIIGKFGGRRPAEIFLNPMRDKDSEINAYKGKIIFNNELPKKETVPSETFDQIKMIQAMANIMNASHQDSLNQLLQKITRTLCQLFQFKRATLALLDPRRKVFVKIIMVGYYEDNSSEPRVLEVPQDVIHKTFDHDRRIRVVYYDHKLGFEDDPLAEERRIQPRRTNGKWHPNDMVILNLVDKNQRTFGYLSLMDPDFGHLPSREVFHNLEIFSNLASLAIEIYYRMSTTEKRNRRLKQLLVTSNIFKLHLSLKEMLSEVVWSIKFSLEFNLVLLGLINRKTNKIEIKAVACDDKIKAIQIKELQIHLNKFKKIFMKQYRQGRSYFVDEKVPVLMDLKDIYYQSKVQAESERYWPWWALFITPIRRKENKIIGFLMVDDPADGIIPSKENIHTLEILTTQLSIAIDNRLTYLEAKGKSVHDKTTFIMEDDIPDSGFRKLVDKVFK